MTSSGSLTDLHHNNNNNDYSKETFSHVQVEESDDDNFPLENDSPLQLSPSKQHQSSPSPGAANKSPGGRTYRCDICQFTTTRPRIFLCHQIVRHHSSASLCLCTECDYASRWRCKVIRHHNMLHKDRPLLPKDSDAVYIREANKVRAEFNSLKKLQMKPTADGALAFNDDDTEENIEQLEKLIDFIVQNGNGASNENGKKIGSLRVQNKTLVDQPNNVAKVCPQCSFSYQMANSWSHLPIHHVCESKTFFCESCQISLENETKVVDHVQWKHKEKQSTDSNKESTRKEETEGNSGQIADQVVCICPVCGYSAPDPSLQDQHMEKVHGEKLHGNSGETNGGVSKPADCQSDDDEEDKSMDQPLSIDISGNCDPLNKSHQDLDDIDASWMSSYIDCSEDENTNQVGGFNATMSDGSAVDSRRRYRCNVCSATFPWHGDLAEHLRESHGMEKARDWRGKAGSYRCTSCKYVAKYQSELRRHMRLHLGVKPFACVFCHYRSAWKGDLKRHIESHHREQFVTDADLCRIMARYKNNAGTSANRNNSSSSPEHQGEVDGFGNVPEDEYDDDDLSGSSLDPGNGALPSFNHHTDAGADEEQSAPSNIKENARASPKQNNSEVAFDQNPTDDIASNDGSESHIQDFSIKKSQPLNSLKKEEQPFEISFNEQTLHEKQVKTAKKVESKRDMKIGDGSGLSANTQQFSNEHIFNQLSQYCNSLTSKDPSTSSKHLLNNAYPSDTSTDNTMDASFLYQQFLQLQFLSSGLSPFAYHSAPPTSSVPYSSQLPTKADYASQLASLTTCSDMFPYTSTGYNFPFVSSSSIVTPQMTPHNSNALIVDTKQTQPSTSSAHSKNLMTPMVPSESYVPEDSVSSSSSAKYGVGSLADFTSGLVSPCILDGEDKTKTLSGGRLPSSLKGDQWKRFKCSGCGHRSNWKWDINKHIKVAHPERGDIRTVMLSLDDAMATLPSYLAAARASKGKTQTGSGTEMEEGYYRPYKCSLCGHRSNWKWDVNKHIKQLHQDIGHAHVITLTMADAKRTIAQYKDRRRQQHHFHSGTSPGSQNHKQGKHTRDNHHTSLVDVPIQKSTKDTAHKKYSLGTIPTTKPDIITDEVSLKSYDSEMTNEPENQTFHNTFPTNKDKDFMPYFETKSNDTEFNKLLSVSHKPESKASIHSENESNNKISATISDILSSLPSKSTDSNVSRSPNNNTSTPIPNPSPRIDTLRLKRFQCSICGYRSNYRSDIARHNRRKHSSQGRVTILGEDEARKSLNAYISTFPQRCSKPTAFNESHCSEDPSSPTESEMVDSESPKCFPYKSESYKMVLSKAPLSSPNPPASGVAPLVWRCCLCSYSHRERVTALRHVSKSHRPLRPFACRLCDYGTDYRNSLIRHIRARHPSVPALNITAHIRQNLKKVRSEFNSAEPSYTEINNQVENPSISLIASQSTYQFPKERITESATTLAFPCPVCSQSFATCQELVLHSVESHVSSDEELYQLYNTDPTSAYQNNLNTTGGQLKCFQCPYTTSRCDVMEVHKFQHLPDCSYQYRCRMCSYKASQSAWLITHEKMHAKVDDLVKHHHSIYSLDTISPLHLGQSHPTDLSVQKNTTDSIQDENSTPLDFTTKPKSDNSQTQNNGQGEKLYSCVVGDAYGEKIKPNRKRKSIVLGDSEDVVCKESESPRSSDSSAKLSVPPLLIKRQYREGEDATMYTCSSCPYTTSQRILMTNHSKSHTGLTTGPHLGRSGSRKYRSSLGIDNKESLSGVQSKSEMIDEEDELKERNSVVDQVVFHLSIVRNLLQQSSNSQVPDDNASTIDTSSSATNLDVNCEPTSISPGAVLLQNPRIKKEWNSLQSCVSDMAPYFP